MRPKDSTGAAAETEGDGAAVETSVDADVKSDPGPGKLPVFDHLQQVSSTLNTMGPNRGKYTNKYTCSIACANGIPCGVPITLYGNGKSESTSNAFKHIREKAEKCPYHKAVIDQLDETNAKRVKNADGNFVPVHSFDEAFPHHVDYVWCRAAGIFGASTGKKPEFRHYVRGACCAAKS